MRIALGADHAGYSLKEHVRTYLEGLGHEVEDVGTHSDQSVDYPDFAALVGERVAEGQAQRGVLVCGAGIGMAIAANKVAGVRAANCFDPFTTHLARAHNDANVLALAGRILAPAFAESILQEFLETPFEGNRHANRVNKIKNLEGASSP
ncbi:MAG: ribose 5-phosphate isomerase B [Deltaproteobacteria bacterium]|nr:ribose 5-phosphate isomerase B [Deltaproteobacteria bacterium]